MKKPKRIENRDLLDFYRTLPCVACGIKHEGVVAHHIKTKGSGGGDTVDNLMPLCQEHHNEIHMIGRKTMLNKYPWLSDYLGNYE